MTKREKIALLLKQTDTDIRSTKNQMRLAAKITGIGNRDLSEEIMTRFDQIVKAYSDVQFNSYDVYEEDEIDFLIKLYSTELGRTIIRKEKFIGEEIMSKYAELTAKEVTDAKERIGWKPETDEDLYGLFGESDSQESKGFTMEAFGDDDDEDEDEEELSEEDFRKKYGL
jgi:hypothetical protein